jgi:penicillin-binding protein 1A
MALGTSLVTPLEMAQAYDTFANGGYRIAAYGIERIRTTGGQVLYQHKTQLAAQAVANPPLGEMQQMMRTVMAVGTGSHANIKGYDLAGKTGTTTDYKDAWFCGFTGGLTTVVWMGRDDATPMRGITGGSAPAEFWRGFMQVALKHTPVQPIPPGPPPPAPLPTAIPAMTAPTPVAPAGPVEGEPNPG